MSKTRNSIITLIILMFVVFPVYAEELQINKLNVNFGLKNILSYLTTFESYSTGFPTSTLTTTPTSTTKELNYNLSVDMNPQIHKYWGYIEKDSYETTLNNDDSINIKLDIKSDKEIDITEIRLYNVCNEGNNVETGKMYTTVNENPALPTIGFQRYLKPVYIALPQCNTYGTVSTFIWDTDDTRGLGTFEYNLKYEGKTPIKIKTIELYIVKKL